MIYFRYGAHIKVKHREQSDTANAKIDPISLTFSRPDHYSNKRDTGYYSNSQNKIPYLPLATDYISPIYMNCASHNNMNDLESSNHSFAFPYVLSKNLVGLTNYYRSVAQ